MLYFSKLSNLPEVELTSLAFERLIYVLKKLKSYHYMLLVVMSIKIVIGSDAWITAS